MEERFCIKCGKRIEYIKKNKKYCDECAIIVKRNLDAIRMRIKRSFSKPVNASNISPDEYYKYWVINRPCFFCNKSDTKITYNYEKGEAYCECGAVIGYLWTNSTIY